MNILGRSASSRILAGILILLGTTACSTIQAPPPDPAPLILVSLDGFRWDFIDRFPTPNLDRITERGVRAEWMIPSFPTKTFPNHYTVATGLYPEHHGLIANNIYDPIFDARFSLSDRDAVTDGRWWDGEPIWVTAEKQGLTAAAFFWPGTEAPIQGIQPTYWHLYDGSIPNTERVDQVVSWLALPGEARPALITLYFSDVDDAAHEFNPNEDRGVAEAVAEVDTRMGQLLDGLAELGIEEQVNIIIVSDHGMAATSAERTIVLDDYIDLETANVVDWSPILGLWPDDTDIDEIYESLAGAHPNLAVYRREEIPERFHFRDNRRIPPIVGIADEGWSITGRGFLERCQERSASEDHGYNQCFSGGTHGYDHALKSMGAIFLAAGPAFREGITIPPFQNVDVYNLLCDLLGLEPAVNDGDPETLRPLLKQNPPYPRVALETEMGNIVLEIYPTQAPVTGSNFLAYVDQGRFNGARFYRTVTLDNQPNNTVKIEVIQGGIGSDPAGRDLTPIRHESTEETGIHHTDGCLSMARLEPGTASSEFFICVGDQPELDYGGQRNPDGEGFAAFGRVVEGMDIVRAIQTAPAAGQRLTPPIQIRGVARID